VSRNCGWCSSVNRLEWEKRVLDGESFQLVSLDTPSTASAGARHFRNCMAGSSVADMRSGAASRMQLGDFAERLLGLANDARAAREYAAQTSNPKLMLQAVREESQVLDTLMTRLGIDQSEMISMLREAKSLAQAVSAVLQDQPTVARALAHHLSTRGEDDLSQAFQAMADRASARQVVQLANNHPKQVSA
jgi:hypothetical protein